MSEEVFDEKTLSSPHYQWGPPPSDQGPRSSMCEGLRGQGGERESVQNNPQMGGVSPTHRRQGEIELYREKRWIFGTAVMDSALATRITEFLRICIIFN